MVHLRAAQRAGLPGRRTRAVGRLPDGVAVHTLRHRPGHRAFPAGAVQPCAPCGRPGAGLPLLPHLRGEVALRRPATDPHLHVLSFAGLDECGCAGAGARQPGEGHPDPVAPGEQPSRLRLFRSQRPRGERGGLHHLPRADRHHAADAAGGAADHGLVPRLPSPPRGPSSSPPGHLRHRLDAARGPEAARRGADAAVPYPAPIT